MRYTVEFAKRAQRQLGSFTPAIRNRLARAIESLRSNPRPPGHRVLSGHTRLYRVRVGDFRIVYEIHDDVLVVLVLRVGPRRDIYRGL